MIVIVITLFQILCMSVSVARGGLLPACVVERGDSVEFGYWMCIVLEAGQWEVLGGADVGGGVSVFRSF